MKKYFFILIIFILATGFLVTLPGGNLTPESIRYVKVAGQRIRVDLAISPEAQTKGLAGRTGLSEGEGMLFIFDVPGKHLFWMKEMNFPIDIIWITENMQVVHVEKNAAPESYPETFGPDAYIKYVLEVPAGYSDKNNLKVGDRILLSD
ncbi:MAG: hypothetical protein UX71_C0006G0021 [Parcubacteria group bacterium GW2011_GWA1_47_10]|nr:MAG: hypothetical protein UX71_C0006G0021 [Parcubacteria group bacterium GW2011_GWA1_47_10]